MSVSTVKRLFLGLGGLFALWLTVKYLLPLVLPFLLGGLVALAAEPLVDFCQRRLRLPRGLSAGIGVVATLLLLAGLLSALGALLFRELIDLAASLPDLESTSRQGISVLRNWAVDLSHRAPGGVQPVLTRTVENAFAGSNAVMDRVAKKLPEMITSLLSGLPDSALRLGTGLLASFMISVRLPRLRSFFAQRLPARWKERYQPVKKALLGWLRAQGILAAITYGILSIGFLLLKIPYGFFWAVLIALMDAVPMLGTGLVLVPWALVSFLMGQSGRAAGLLVIFAAATLSRTTLEPKLVGHQLGLDPLVTLLALYVGYRLWGFLGLLSAPILTAVGKTVLDSIQ